MAEYIEREALLKELKQSREWYAETSRDFALLVRCENIVREQTAADVAPVRHGQWVELGYKWQCSCCGGKVNLDGTPADNRLLYCPNCGAKMDLNHEQEES